jgi:hypothetical protein
MSEFVMVKRELAERLDSTHSYVRNAARDELRAVLAQEAGKGDVFAWAVEISGTEKIFSSKKSAENARHRYEKVFDAEYMEPFPIFRHPAEPPAPVAVVLPERREFSPQSDAEWGWNACLDKVKEMNP